MVGLDCDCEGALVIVGSFIEHFKCHIHQVSEEFENCYLLNVPGVDKLCL